MKRDKAAMRRCLETQERCRVCGSEANLHPHHVVNRSLVQNDDDLNLVALCFACHRDVHAKQFNLGVHLTRDEQAHAVKLIGLGAAHDLLMPTYARRAS